MRCACAGTVRHAQLVRPAPSLGSRSGASQTCGEQGRKQRIQGRAALLACSVGALVRGPRRARAFARCDAMEQAASVYAYSRSHMAQHLCCTNCSDAPGFMLSSGRRERCTLQPSAARTTRPAPCAPGRRGRGAAGHGRRRPGHPRRRAGPGLAARGRRPAPVRAGHAAAAQCARLRCAGMARGSLFILMT